MLTDNISFSFHGCHVSSFGRFPEAGNDHNKLELRNPFFSGLCAKDMVEAKDRGASDLNIESYSNCTLNSFSSIEHDGHFSDVQMIDRHIVHEGGHVLPRNRNLGRPVPDGNTIFPSVVLVIWNDHANDGPIEI